MLDEPDAKQLPGGADIVLPVHTKHVKSETLNRRRSSDMKKLVQDALSIGQQLTRELSENYGAVDAEDGRQRARWSVIAERLYLDKRAFVAFYLIALACLYFGIFVYPYMETTPARVEEDPAMSSRALLRPAGNRLSEAASPVRPITEGGHHASAAMMGLAESVIERMRRDSEQCLTARHLGFDYDLVVLLDSSGSSGSQPRVMWNTEVSYTYGDELRAWESSDLVVGAKPSVVARPEGVTVRYLHWSFVPGDPQPVSSRTYRAKSAAETRCILHCIDVNSGQHARTFGTSEH